MSFRGALDLPAARGRISDQFFLKVNFPAYGENPRGKCGVPLVGCLSGELNHASQSLGCGRDGPIGSRRADQHQAER
jgi:hypothetical protein